MGDFFTVYSLAVNLQVNTLISTVEELSIEQLYSNYSKYKLEQDVHNQDVEDVLERVDYTVEHSLELGHPLNCLERPQHSQHTQGLYGA